MIVATFIQSFGQQLPLFLIIQARIGALFSSLFFLRKEFVPARILAGFSFVLAVFVLCSGHFEVPQTTPSFLALVPTLLTQIVLGLMTGFIINFFAEIFLGLGQIASMQAGLGFVNFYVPKLGTITPLTQFFMMTVTMIFFELNGHLVLIKMIVNSLQLISKPTRLFDRALILQLLMFAKIIFSGSFMLSLAITIAVLLSNLTIAVMTKFSPQINIFSIGINISLLVCYFVAYISFDLIVEQGGLLLNDLFEVVGQVQS